MVRTGGFDRRQFCIASIAAGVSLHLPTSTIRAAAKTIRFGLTPVFVNDDLELLARLRAFLERSTGTPVELVQRRTYEEITSLLISGQLTAAWICGYPFIQYRDRL